MKKFLKTIVCCLVLGASTMPALAQCTAENTAFKAGETLVYDLYFNWKFVWLKAGTASMNVAKTNYSGIDGYRCNLITKGSQKADRFFVMRDTLVSIIDENMTPLYFRKGALEGERYHVDEVWYSYKGGKSNIKQRYRNHHGEEKIQQHRSTACIYDMLSMLLRARSFDANTFKKGQRFHFPMADGDDVKQETLVYRGKAKFKMENTNVTYRCLKFSFVEKEDGKEKEIITFFISDDKNHLPVRLDMFLRFGTAKAFLVGTRGLRNPQTSIIK